MFKGLHPGSCFSYVYACQHQLAMLYQTNKLVLLLCILGGDNYLDFNSRHTTSGFCCVKKQSLSVYFRSADKKE